MNSPDEFARITPFELGLPGRPFVETGFEAVATEARERGTDLTDPGAFMLLGEVGRLLREIQGDERGAEALQRYGALLYHAFHFHSQGECLVLLERATARYLIDGEGLDRGWSGSLPTPAGYLQLPRHLFWVNPTEDGPAEPLDGLFWARAAGEALMLMAVSGIHGQRAGFSSLALPPVPLADAERWGTEKVRDEGDDFATTLPGGEMDRLYSLTTVGELLKLASRALGYWTGFPQALSPLEAARGSTGGRESKRSSPGARGSAPGADPPSALPFFRLQLVH